MCIAVKNLVTKSLKKIKCEDIYNSLKISIPFLKLSIKLRHGYTKRNKNCWRRTFSFCKLFKNNDEDLSTRTNNLKSITILIMTTWHEPHPPPLPICGKLRSENSCLDHEEGRGGGEMRPPHGISSWSRCTFW